MSESLLRTCTSVRFSGRALLNAGPLLDKNGALSLPFQAFRSINLCIIRLFKCLINYSVTHSQSVCAVTHCYRGLHHFWYDIICLLTAIGLSPGGSTHLHTNNTWNNTNNNRKTQIATNVEECGPRPVFESFTLASALQLRKKHGKTSFRVRRTSFRVRETSVRMQCTYYQNIHILQNLHTHTHTHTDTHTLQNPHIYNALTLQNNIKPDHSTN
jgi:hypothetical protein